MTLKTESERRFADYLTNNGYAYKYEPTSEGKLKRPDFTVSTGVHEIYCEVKERVATEDTPKGHFDPYRGLRYKIDKAWGQFREFERCCCALVICNLGDLKTILDPEFVFAAMLGNLGVQMAIDHQMQKPLPETNKTVFTRRGKMVRGKTGEYKKTTISAIIVLEHVSLRDREFECAFEDRVRLRQRGEDRVLSRLERACVRVDLWKERCPTFGHINRVVVHENPRAGIQFPPVWFTGPYDERWAMIDGQVSHVYQGIKVPELAL